MKRKTTRRTGQGTIYQRADKRWEGAITYGYNEKGNPKRYRVIKRSRAEAATALQNILTKLNLGLPAVQEKQTLDQFLDRWYAEMVLGKRAPKTASYYEQMTRLYIRPALGHLQISKVTPAHIQAMLNQMEARGLSPRTVQAARATLRAALTRAWKWNLIHENPVAKVDPPLMPSKEPIYLSLEDANKLVTASKDHYLGNLIELTLHTGLRLGEATGLTWADVDFDRSVIHIRQQLQRVSGTLTLRDLKTGKSRRTLYLGDAAKQAMKRQKAKLATQKVPSTICFTTLAGNPLDCKTVDKNLKKLCDQAGIRAVSFHKLRHTAATHMAALGVPLGTIKDQLGHSQIGLTANLYRHAVPLAMKKAAATLERAYKPSRKSVSRAKTKVLSGK